MQLIHTHALCWHANGIQSGQKRALYSDSANVCMLSHSSLLDPYIEHQTLAACDQAKAPNSSCMTAYCTCHNSDDPGISLGFAKQCNLDMYLKSYILREKVHARFGMRML